MDSAGVTRKNRAPVTVPPQAVRVQRCLAEYLGSLTITETPLPDKEIARMVGNVYRLYDSWYTAVTQNYPDPCRCHRGCARCCNHWVEDVNSFETINIIAFVKTWYPDRLGAIRDACGEDRAWIARLDATAQRKAGLLKRAVVSDPDLVDILLHCFYQLRRPCPLLDRDGCCMIYPVRPLTCRAYLSFSDPCLCSAEYIHDTRTATALLDLDDTVAGLLDTLHFMYDRFENDTGLRSVLARYL